MTALLSRPGVVLAAVGVHLMAALLIQTTLWTGGRNDDAELLLHAQTWAVAYDALNPPLADWIAWALARLVGPGLLATRLLATLALVGMYGGLALLVRHLTPRPAVQAAALVAPATLLHLNFYVFLNLSHTLVLLLGMVAALWATVATVRTPRPTRAFGLGLVLGLAALTKANAILGLAALALAVLLLPTPRRALGRPSILLPLLAGGLLVAGPVYAALAARLPAFLALYDSKMGLTAPLPWIEGLGRGLASVAEQAASVLLPGVAIAVLLFWPWPRSWTRSWPGGSGGSPTHRATSAAARPTTPADAADPTRPPLPWPLALVGLVPILYGLLLVGLVLVGQSTRFDAHHLLPLALGIVPLTVWLADRRPDGAPRATVAFTGIGLGLCLVSLGALVQFTWQTAQTCTGKCNIVLPYAAYARDLRAAGFTGGTLVQLTSVHHLPLANLRPYFPDSRLVRPLDDRAGGFVPPRRDPPGDCVLIWDAARPPLPPPALAAALGLDTLPADRWQQGESGRHALALSGRPAPVLAWRLLPGGGALCP